ncbi:MAG: FtsX-like permease family protein [Ruminococcus sp.]|nr:FtsX-like permease family protein [Ruminococcus sp.]
MSKVLKYMKISWLMVYRSIKINLRMFLLVSLFILLCSSCSVLFMNFEKTYTIGESMESIFDLYNGKEYHYYLIETGVRILRLLNIISYAFLFLSLMVLMIKKVISEETDYVFMRCLGYRVSQIAFIIFLNYILLFLFASVAGFLLSALANKLSVIILDRYLYSDKIFDISAFILIELSLLIYSIIVSFFFSLRIKNKPVSKLFGGRI